MLAEGAVVKLGPANHGVTTPTFAYRSFHDFRMAGRAAAPERRVVPLANKAPPESPVRVEHPGAFAHTLNAEACPGPSRPVDQGSRDSTGSQAHELVGQVTH